MYVTDMNKIIIVYKAFLCMSRVRARVCMCEIFYLFDTFFITNIFLNHKFSILDSHCIVL